MRCPKELSGNTTDDGDNEFLRSGKQTSGDIVCQGGQAGIGITVYSNGIIYTTPLNHVRHTTKDLTQDLPSCSQCTNRSTPCSVVTFSL